MRKKRLQALKTEPEARIEAATNRSVTNRGTTAGVNATRPNAGLAINDATTIVTPPAAADALALATAFPTDTTVSPSILKITHLYHAPFSITKIKLF